MSIQHNELPSLDWLMPTFEEYMTALTNQWHTYQNGKGSAISKDMAQDYHQLSGAMTMANMPLFATLATGLSLLSQAINDTRIDKSKALSIGFSAHRLLQVELNKCSLSGSFHKLLLITSIRRIAELLADEDSVEEKLNLAELNKLSPINSNLTKLVAVNDSIKQAQLLRQIRINLENIKNEFKQYTNENDVAQLPIAESFEAIRDNLSSMKLIEVIEVVDEFIELFNRFRENNLHEVSWDISEAVLASINEFELFFDNLAQKIVNMDKLEETLDHINHTNSLINQFLQDKEDKSAKEKEKEQATKVEKKPTMSSAVLDEVRNNLTPDDFSMDEEIREIFIEEADEVLTSMDENYLVWKKKQSDFDVLTDIRRGFHTLKGSGRMVGAHSVGETAWAVENLLNRVLDKSIAPSDVLVDFIAEVKKKLPTLVEDFTKEQAPSLDPAIIILQANNLLAGKDINDGVVFADAQEDSSSEEIFEGEFNLPEALNDIWDNAQNLLPEDSSKIDENIKINFAEEAKKALAMVVLRFTTWLVDIDNIDKVTELAEGFHTLEDLGNNAGANIFAELAKSIKDMLNGLLDANVGLEPSMLELISDVLYHYPSLITLFEEDSNAYPDALPLWITCANGYGNNLGQEFDYRHLIPFFLEKEERGKSIDELMQDNSHVLGSIHYINKKLNEDVTLDKAELSEEEHEFISIFMEEAEQLLTVINDFVETHKGQQEIEIDDAIVRAFHTLRGASGSQSLHSISEVSQTVEASLVHLQHNESKMTAQHLQAIAQSAGLIAKRLANYQQSLGTTKGDDSSASDDSALENIQGLIADTYNDDNTLKAELDIQTIIIDIDELLESELELEENLQGSDKDVIAYAQLMSMQIELLQSRTVTSNSFQMLLTPLHTVYQRIVRQPKLAKNEKIVTGLNLANEELINLFDALAGNMSLKVDEQVLQTLELIINSTAPQETLDSRVEETTAEIEEIETDEELLEIFLEEARELERDINKSFSVWKEEPNNLDALRELQRYLHTIKGGARMAGISSIGDLTHEVETIYERFVNEEMTPSVAWSNVMQVAQDILSMQIEYLENHSCSFFSHETIKQLHKFMKLKELPDDASLTSPNLQGLKRTEETAEPIIEDMPDETDEEEDKEVEVVTRFNNLKRESWNGAFPDDDILNVFLEEVDELIEDTTELLQGFRSNTSDLSKLQELQRELHTVKGGARMVGAEGIANLAHEMETIYEGLGGRQLPATDNVMGLLINCHDWLANSVQVLKNTINPPAPTELIEALKVFHREPDNLKDIPSVSLQEYLDVVSAYEVYRASLQGTHDTSIMPKMVGDFGDFKETADNNSEAIRVPASMMEQMINLSGESVINRARVDMGVNSLTNSIEEMGITVQRLADQLRRMDIELEAQILSQIDDATLLESENFDPLEMDQYSSLNQLSKSLSESASDLLDIKSTLLEKVRDNESLLLQLSRTQTELQDNLMNSRMVPFSRLIPRLQRIVRQTANEVNKQVNLTVVNADDEMDRSILERITSPLEHMLRNAVDHGIETPEERIQSGKESMGQVVLSVSREGSEIVIELSDDGHGIDVESVRRKAISQGLIDPNDDSLTDTDIMQYIFNAGLSTTKKVTQISGRGVGMDVVRSEIRQLGGVVSVDSTKGKGSRFIMRVPLTVAVSDALIVRAADRHYVIPLVQIERVEQVNPDDLFNYYQSDSHTFRISDTDYRLRYLNEILTGSAVNDLSVAGHSTLPVIIIKNQTGQNIALQVDEIVGSRIEVVVKPLGKQLSHVSGISAATIMGDGSIMLILDLIALIRNAPIRKVSKIDTPQVSDVRKKILVIDDSVTVRKVTSRFLEREGFDAMVAKDGVDALKILQEYTPDLMLLDIEMPRMDGFEVATQVRHNDRLKDTPIIMITSRTGDKHRERAVEVGVNDYLGKPFQESILLECIGKQLGLDLVLSDDE